MFFPAISLSCKELNFFRYVPIKSKFGNPWLPGQVGLNLLSQFSGEVCQPVSGRVVYYRPLLFKSETVFDGCTKL